MLPWRSREPRLCEEIYVIMYSNEKLTGDYKGQTNNNARGQQHSHWSFLIYFLMFSTTLCQPNENIMTTFATSPCFCIIDHQNHGKQKTNTIFPVMYKTERKFTSEMLSNFIADVQGIFLPINFRMIQYGFPLLYKHLVIIQITL